MHSLRHCEVEILLVTTMNSAFLFRHLDGMFGQVGRSRGYQGPMAVVEKMCKDFCHIQLLEA